MISSSREKKQWGSTVLSYLNHLWITCFRFSFFKLFKIVMSNNTSCGVSEIERVRFLIQNNECVNTVQSTFHMVLCLLHTYWDWTPSLNYDKLYLNKCGQTTITERKQLGKKRKSWNKIQNLWNKVGLSEFNSPPSLRLTEQINSARYLSRSSGVIADNSRSLWTWQ